ncbi:MAG: S1/P1 nuclease, partial [Bacteroidota bacterium]|nr:S1/P1 nuclease [Bacteroidota bacterium]
MKKLFLPLLILQFAFTNVQASDWGQTGHRVIGLVAEQHLTQKTKAAIDDLLQGESLAFVSTYGDEIRSNKEFKHFDPWHYVNMPLDKRYGAEKPNPKGDVYHAIQHCAGVLHDNESTRDDKAFYLRLLVHFVGDLHQPLHVGRLEDRGG